MSGARRHEAANGDGARTPYPEAARNLLRETLFGAARDELERRAWSDVTMSDVASAAGVSRQTLYKEFGSRDEFAQAFVIHVGERFLDEVDAAVREHLDDPRAAIGAALETFLRTAGEDPLVRVLLSDDGTGGMLPFVTTQGMPVVVFATARLFETIREGWPEAPPDKAQLLAESLVRLAISYVTAPSAEPDRTAAQAGELLGPFIDRRPRRRRLSRRADDDLRPHRVGYARCASADPRIAAFVEAALGDARSVLNVGAGTGSYEPADREVTAVEPSEVMIAQRAARRRAGRAGERRGAALRGRQLRRRDGDDHRPPLARPGGRAWGRCAASPATASSSSASTRRRSRILVARLLPAGVRDPLRLHAAARGARRAARRRAAVETVPIPRRCSDGFFFALWDRPELHLDPEVRRGSTVWHVMSAEEIERGLAALRADLESGRWDERHGHLRDETAELDLGLRLLVAELG